MPKENETSTERELRLFFSYEHLREDLQPVSKPFCELARAVVLNLPDNRERQRTIDRLLEAKDAAVRSFIDGRDRDKK